MPSLVRPAHPAGALRALAQPVLDLDDQLILRPWRSDDAEFVKTAFDDLDVQRWHVRRMDTTDEALAWTAAWATRWAAETDASWAIAGRRDDEPIGQAGLRAISLSEGSAELSYWVAPAARGAGVAVRAAHTVTRWTFDTVGLHPPAPGVPARRHLLAPQAFPRRPPDQHVLRHLGRAEPRARAARLPDRR